MKRGVFITFEGGEGAGKTTLIESISKVLSSRGLAFIKTREPGGTVLGEKVRSILLSKKGEMDSLSELALFLAARAEHIKEVIIPSLQRGEIVLCDRFNDSSIAYQGFARGLGELKVAKACSLFSSDLVPNLTIYLDIDPKIGLKRISRRKGKDRIEQEEVSFHEKIREGFLRLQKQDPHRIRQVDAGLKPEEVLQEAMQAINLVIEKGNQSV